MANYYNPNTPMEKLINFGVNNVEVATDQQIKDSIIQKMQKIYGNDIDVSRGTADEQWIMALTNLFKHMFECPQKLSQSLDPNEASGKYLDVVCSFNNIFRKEASHSKVYLFVKPINNQNINNQEKIECKDKVGNIWTWENEKNLNDDWQTEIPANGIVLLFKCNELGKIQAFYDSNINRSNLVAYEHNGDVGEVIDTTTYPFHVWQLQDAIVGKNEESDDELRSRRNLEAGNNGITTLSSLEASLREIEGINDVKIFNNSTNSNITLDVSSSDNNYKGDDCTVNAHNVYICLKYDNFLNPNKSDIANIILNKMTPGISTQTYNVISGSTTSNITEYGTNESFEISIQENINQILNWKVAYPRAISMKINLLVSSNFSLIDDNKKIKRTIIDFTDNLKFNDTFIIANLINTLNVNSRSQNNLKTYIAISGEFYNSEGNSNNPTYTSPFEWDNASMCYSHYAYFNYSDDTNGIENPWLNSDHKYYVEYDEVIQDDLPDVEGTYSQVTIKVKVVRTPSNNS